MCTLNDKTFIRRGGLNGYVMGGTLEFSRLNKSCRYTTIRSDMLYYL